MPAGNVISVRRASQGSAKAPVNLYAHHHTSDVCVWMALRSIDRDCFCLADCLHYTLGWNCHNAGLQRWRYLSCSVCSSAVKCTVSRCCLVSCILHLSFVSRRRKLMMALRRLRISLERGDQFHRTEVILILITYSFGISLRKVSEFELRSSQDTDILCGHADVYVYACDIWETGFL